MEVIELLSDSDTPPPGDASNPILLDSDDEADQRGSSVYPLLEASQSTLRRKNIDPDPPSGSNHLARSHTLQNSSPPDTGDEFHDAESPSVQRISLSPQSEHSIQAVDQPSAVNGKTDHRSLPIRDSSEIQDKMPDGVSENTREASSPVASPPSPMSPESRNMGISDRLAISRISSSPNRSHLPPVDASADSSAVPVRGTLYSGRSGLWEGFFRVTTAGSTSPLRPPGDVDVEEEGDARSKGALTPPRANSPYKITPTTLVSLAQNLSIRSSPTPSSVDGRGLEISDDPTNTTLKSVSPAIIGEPSVSHCCLLHTYRHSQVDGLSVVQFTPARTMLEFAPRVFYSRDIPHALQDLMNSVEAPYRQSIAAKEMFEAVIYENTYDDEPSAPRISIVNDVDGDLEVTPAWEFHYSNHIWHSDNVPPADLANLRGCDCEGYCDPNSQTCSCLKRQQEYSGHIPGFIYDDKSRLKQRGFPIFECNDLCGCLDGCRNRVRLHQIPRNIANLFCCLKVVQHGRQYGVNIRKTTNKGWGMSLNIFVCVI